MIRNPTALRSGVMAGRRRLAIAALTAGTLLVVSCGTNGIVEHAPDTAPVTTNATPDALPAPAGLGERDLDLRAGPVAEPIELRIPAIDVDAAILGVGITANDVMDA